jgi:transposase-like protein
VSPPDSSGLWFGDDFGSDGWEFESLRARKVSAGSDLRCYTDKALADAGASVISEPMHHRCIKTFARGALGITRFPVELSGERCFVARFEKAGEATG